MAKATLNQLFTMTESKLTDILGISLAVAHILLVFLVILMWGMSWFSFEEATTTISIVLPLLGVLVTGVVRTLTQRRNVISQKSRRVNSAYVFVALWFPCLYVISVALAILAQGVGQILDSFEHFKALLAIIETVFGGYVGIALAPLFGFPETEK